MAFELRSIVRMGDNDGWRLSVGNGANIHNFDDEPLLSMKNPPNSHQHNEHLVARH